jgi:Uma2 family endonuclease
MVSRADTAASRDACASLKTFNYSSEDEFEVKLNNIALPELVSLLRSRKGSLEELCLSLWEHDAKTRESGYEIRAFKCLPSLSEFTSLKKLDCHMSCWPDNFLKESMHGEGWHEQRSRRLLNDQEAKNWHDRLPSSLTHLIIREMEESPHSEHNIRVQWDLRQLENLVNIRHELLPNLKTLDLVMDCGERIHGRQRYNINSRKVQLADRASDNDDGFVFEIVSPRQYRRAHGNVFLTEDDSCRTPMYWIRWDKGRFVQVWKDGNEMPWDIPPTWGDSDDYNSTDCSETEDIESYSRAYVGNMQDITALLIPLPPLH